MDPRRSNNVEKLLQVAFICSSFVLLSSFLLLLFVGVFYSVLSFRTLSYVFFNVMFIVLASVSFFFLFLSSFFFLPLCVATASVHCDRFKFHWVRGVKVGCVQDQVFPWSHPSMLKSCLLWFLRCLRLYLTLQKLGLARFPALFRSYMVLSGHLSLFLSLRSFGNLFISNLWFSDPTYWSPILDLVFNFNSVSPHVQYCRNMLGTAGEVDGPHFIAYTHH